VWYFGTVHPMPHKSQVTAGVIREHGESPSATRLCCPQDNEADGLLEDLDKAHKTADLTRKYLLTYYFPMRTAVDHEPEVFNAINSPARRRILDLLADGDQPVNRIAGHFDMSRPAISQHLRILLSAGLVSEQRQGREHHYRLVPERLDPVRNWMAQYERFWDDNFKRLRTHLAVTAAKRSKG
jgi:DNA-binding transcriptional ArsR family regulator